MVDHVTFVGEGGYGWFCLSKNFFSQISGVRKFFPDIRQCKSFFSALYTSWAIFFSVQDIIYFHPVISLQAFPPQNQSAGYFYLKSPITPSKVKLSAPKIHQTFAQLTDFDLSIISKAFWNNRGQNSLRERGGIRFYLPLPGESVRTYGNVINKFSQMDSLPNCLGYGAPSSPRQKLRY